MIELFTSKQLGVVVRAWLVQIITLVAISHTTTFPNCLYAQNEWKTERLNDAKVVGMKVGNLFWKGVPVQGRAIDSEDFLTYQIQRMAIFQAEDLWYQLKSNPAYSVKQKQAYAKSLMNFASLCSGRFPSSLAEYHISLSNKLDPRGALGWGTFSPSGGFTLSASALGKELDVQVFIATSLVMQALEFSDKLSRELTPKSTRQEVAKKIQEWDQLVRTSQSDSYGVERTAAKKALAICTRLFDAPSSGLQDLAKGFGLEWQKLKEAPSSERIDSTSPNRLVLSRSDLPYSEFNAESYKDRLQKVRRVNKGSKQLKKSASATPNTSVFGGIKLWHHAIPAKDERCLSLKIRLEKNFDGYLDFTIQRAGRESRCSYGPVAYEELYAAYHIIAPDAIMQTLAGVEDGESEIFFSSEKPNGAVAFMHPALERTEIAQRMISLENASSALGKNYAIKQWESLPAVVLFEDGKVSVRPQENSDFCTIALRFFRAVNPADQEFSQYGNDKLYIKLNLQAISAMAENHSSYWSNERIEGVLRDYSSTERILEAEQFLRDKRLEELDRSSLDLRQVDGFCRLLSLMRWAHQSLGQEFPAWPAGENVPSYPVASIRADPEQQIPISPLFNRLPPKISIKANMRFPGLAAAELSDLFNPDATIAVAKVNQQQIILDCNTEGTERFSEFLRLVPVKEGESEQFLAETKLFDWRTESIARFSDILKKTEDKFAGIVEVIKKLEPAIRTNFHLEMPTCASESLARGEGCCRENGVILTSILRGAGIPARPVSGFVITAGEAFATPHMWIEAAIDGYWYRIDSAMYGVTSDTLYLRLNAFYDNNVKFQVRTIFKDLEFATNDVPTDSMTRFVPTANRDITAAEQAEIAKVLTSVAMAQIRCMRNDSYHEFREFANKMKASGITISSEYLRGLKLHRQLLTPASYLAIIKSSNRPEVRKSLEEKTVASYRLPFLLAFISELEPFMVISPSLEDDSDLEYVAHAKSQLADDLKILGLSDIESTEVLRMLNTMQKIENVLEHVRSKLGAPKISKPSDIDLSR